MVGAFSAGLLLLAGCSAFSTGGTFDRWSSQRLAFMRQERALRERPDGAKNVLNEPDEIRSSDGIFGHKVADAGTTWFELPATYKIDDLTDFYIDLFAKQHHTDIYVSCHPTPPQSPRSIQATAWKDHYGYMVSVYVGHDSETTPDGGIAPPILTNPYAMSVGIAGNKNAFHGSTEAPVNDCPDYPLERMAKILRPYGLTPIPKFAGWIPFTLLDGTRNSYRKLPPRPNQKPA